MKFFKHWPYWARGLIISAGCILLLAIILSIAVASSSLCGLNSGPGESHTCNLSERIQAFGGIMRMILIFPLINTLHSIFKYHSLEILLQATDGFSIMLIIVCTLLLGSGLGWLYGKIKNRNQET